MPVFSSRSTDVGPSDQALAASGVPDTSPTWELELLISGAVLFALFQLPGALNAFFARLEPHLTAAVAPAELLVALYARAIVYALIASFVVHLVARAYWVGLVGLHSVFPRGVQWDELRAGPISLDVYRERFASLPAVIARVDNFCSVIFSFAFLLAIIFAFTILVSGVLAGTAYLLAQLFAHGRHVRELFLLFGALMALVPATNNTLDRRLGPRLAPDSRGARAIRRTARVAYRLSLLNITGPIFLTLLTNIGRRKLLVIFYTVLFGIVVFVVADRLARSDRLSVNGYDYFGASATHGVDYRFYESQRDADEILPRMPSIQSDVIRDAYVKLFIPLSPARHNALVAKRCPGVRPIQERGVQLGAEPPVPDSLAMPVLKCLARIHAMTLDDVPLADPDFRFYEHPRSGLKGIIAYLPADGLAPGRHVLTVQPAPSVDDDAPKTPPRPFVIAFWK